MDKRLVDLIEWIVKNGEGKEQTIEVLDLLYQIGVSFDVPQFVISSTVKHITQEV